MYMKKIVLIFSVFVSALMVSAQTSPSFAYGFPMAGKSVGPLYVAMGLPFYKVASTPSGSIKADPGVAHALLVTTHASEETCENVPYSDPAHGFDFPAPLAVGTTEHSKYTVHGTHEKYDELYLLTLTVHPTYDVYDTVMYHGTMPAGITEGDNDVTWTTIHGCDSVVHLYALLCPMTAEDGDHLLYPTVVMNDRYCWTQQNLKATHYTDGTSVPNAMVYQTAQYPDATENLNTYGRLYTWFSAMGVNEDGSETPVPDAKGFYQGICPDGWHVPTQKEFNALFSYAVEDLNSTELWVNGLNNTNSTGFTALPAGQYNGQLNRFEGLRSQTNFWSCLPTSSTYPSALTLMIAYYCSESMLVNKPTNDAYSVRCVKNY